MSTTFYAGHSSGGARVEIAFRENGGRIHWKVPPYWLTVCCACVKPLDKDEPVAHDEYGRNFTFRELMVELTGKPDAPAPNSDPWSSENPMSDKG